MTEAKEIAREMRDVADKYAELCPSAAMKVRQAADLLDPPLEGPWEPVHDENYWYLDEYGYAEEDLWEDMTADRRALAIGNVYRTREEAERAAARMRAMTKLRRAKGVTVLTAMGSDPLILVNYIYEADTPENFEAAWAALTDEERAALLEGE